ncbi:MAG: heparinase II/III-family protein, partial [Armatimonadetes bacterium]|nr:heparinase II/III-family protein [Armatimonadota bacterium]
YGHYPYWTGMSGQLQSFLQSLTLSYAVTGRAEFAARAKEFCLALADWQVWTDPDYHPNLTPCLDTGHFLQAGAAGLDICHDSFSAEERRTVVDAMDRLGLQPTFAWVTRGEQQVSEFNLEILLNAALGIAALAAWEDLDPARREQYLAQARSYFLRFLDRKRSSPNTEGLAYSSALDEGSIFADALRRATGDTAYFDHPHLIQDLPRWLAYFAGPNRSGGVNFGDCGGYPRPFATTLKLLNNGGHGLAGWLLAQYGIGADGATWAGLLYDRAARAAKPPAGWPASGLVPTIGWAALRTGWGPADTLLAFKCSSSTEGHDHSDQGNLVLNVGGTWLLTDLGYGSFRNEAEGAYSRGTPGHNCILVDGQGQTRRAGRIAAFHADDRLDYALGDATACYDPRLVTGVRRHVAFVKPGWFVVVDELASDGSPREFAALLHCDGTDPFLVDGRAPVVGETAAVRTIRVAKQRAEADVHVLAPAGATARYAAWPGTEANYPPFLTLAGPQKVSRQVFVQVIEPRRRAGEILDNGGFEDGAQGWTLGGEPGSQVAAAVDDRISHTGRRSVRLTGSDPQRDRTLYGQWYLPCLPGALYRASVWCRTQGLDGQGPTLDLTFYDGSRKHTPPVGGAGGRQGDSDWHQMVVEMRAPEGAALMTFRCGMHWCRGALWFDDARIEQLDPKPDLPPQVERRFELVGDPAGGAFGVRMNAAGQEDLLLLNLTAAPAAVAGETVGERLLLVRREGGQVTRVSGGVALGE